MCRTPDVTPRDLAELLASMQSGVDLMVTITSDLLDLEKLRLGRFEVHPGVVALAELIQDVATAARPACRGDLTATVHPDAPRDLFTDGGRLRQVPQCEHAFGLYLL